MKGFGGLVDLLKTAHLVSGNRWDLNIGLFVALRGEDFKLGMKSSILYLKTLL